MAVLRTTSESLLFKSLLKFCLHNDNNEINDDIHINSHNLCCSSQIYGYLYVCWMSYLYCFEWKKLESYISNPSDDEFSTSSAFVKLQINETKDNINCIKLSTSERYLAVKAGDEILIISLQEMVLAKQLNVLHRIRMAAEDKGAYTFEWNRFDMKSQSASAASALDRLAVITNTKIVFFEPFKKTASDVTRTESHTAEYSQFLAACWHPSEPTLLAVADGNQVHLFKNGKTIHSSQMPLMRSLSSTDSTVIAINHLNWFDDNLLLVGYEYPDPDDEQLLIHAMDLLRLTSANGGGIAAAAHAGVSIDFSVVTDMSAEFENICAPSGSSRTIAQQYYSCFIPSWNGFLVMSNMSTAISFLRVNRDVLDASKGKAEAEEEVSALCVEEAVDQKPLALEPVAEGAWNVYPYPLGLALGLNSSYRLLLPDTDDPVGPFPLFCCLTTESQLLVAGLVDSADKPCPDIRKPGSFERVEEPKSLALPAPTSTPTPTAVPVPAPIILKSPLPPTLPNPPSPILASAGSSVLPPPVSSISPLLSKPAPLAQLLTVPVSVPVPEQVPVPVPPQQQSKPLPPSSGADVGRTTAVGVAKPAEHSSTVLLSLGASRDFPTFSWQHPEADVLALGDAASEQTTVLDTLREQYVSLLHLTHTLKSDYNSLSSSVSVAVDALTSVGIEGDARALHTDSDVVREVYRREAKKLTTRTTSLEGSLTQHERLLAMSSHPKKSKILNLMSSVDSQLEAIRQTQQLVKLAISDTEAARGVTDQTIDLARIELGNQTGVIRTNNRSLAQSIEFRRQKAKMLSGFYSAVQARSFERRNENVLKAARNAKKELMAATEQNPQSPLSVFLSSAPVAAFFGPNSSTFVHRPTEPIIASKAPALEVLKTEVKPIATASALTQPPVAMKVPESKSAAAAAQPPVPTKAPGVFGQPAESKPAAAAQPPVPTKAPGVFGQPAESKPAAAAQPPVPTKAPGVFGQPAESKPAAAAQPPVPTKAPGVFGQPTESKPAAAAQPPVPTKAPGVFGQPAESKPAAAAQPPVPTKAPGVFGQPAESKPAAAAQPPVPTKAPGVFGQPTESKPAAVAQMSFGKPLEPAKSLFSSASATTPVVKNENIDTNSFGMSTMSLFGPKASSLDSLKTSNASSATPVKVESPGPAKPSLFVKQPLSGSSFSSLAAPAISSGSPGVFSRPSGLALSTPGSIDKDLALMATPVTPVASTDAFEQRTAAGAPPVVRSSHSSATGSHSPSDSAPGQSLFGSSSTASPGIGMPKPFQPAPGAGSLFGVKPGNKPAGSVFSSFSSFASPADGKSAGTGFGSSSGSDPKPSSFAPAPVTTSFSSFTSPGPSSTPVASKPPAVVFGSSSAPAGTASKSQSGPAFGSTSKLGVGGTGAPQFGSTSSFGLGASSSTQPTTFGAAASGATPFSFAAMGSSLSGASASANATGASPFNFSQGVLKKNETQ